jgi:hypothetical protein
MGDNQADDPEFAYYLKKGVGRDGKLYAELHETEGEVGGFVKLTTTASTKIYQPTSAIAKVHLRSIILSTSGVSAMGLALIDADSATTMMYINVASGATAIRTLALTGLKGPVFTTGFYAKATRKGAFVSYNVVLDPGLPSV